MGWSRMAGRGGPKVSNEKVYKGRKGGSKVSNGMV